MTYGLLTGLRRMALYLVCVMALTGLSGRVDADTGLIKDAAVVRDVAGTLTIDTVQAQTFVPTSDIILAGYTGAAFWFRLTILPDASGEDTVLIIRPPTFDRVTLYAPAPGRPGEWTETRLGGTVPVGAEELVSSLRAFRLEPAPGGTVYYLKLMTTGSFSAQFVALSHSKAHRVGLLLDMAQITYMALMLALMLWSLRMALATREFLFWWFAILQFGWIFHNMFYFGYVALLFPALPQDMIFLTYRAAVIGVSAASVGFHRIVLGRFKPHWITLRLLEAMIVVMAIAFVTFWVGSPTKALRMNAIAIAISPIAFFLTAYSARVSASPGLGAMRVIYTLLSAALLLWVFNLLGITQMGTFALYGTMIHGTATGCLMAAILHLHGRNVLNEARQAQSELGALQQRRAFEQEQTKTLMRFIDMLTHETKNVMAVINMSVSAPRFGERQQQRVAEAIRDLTTVVDRCNLEVLLDSQEQPITRVPCDAVAILRETGAARPTAGRIAIQTPEAATLRSDPVLLRVIMTNLIENALKYSPPDSRVDVSLSSGEDGRVTLIVENDAGQAGLPDPEKVFQKYYRSHRAQSQIGSGLGLYLVQGLARLLGGGIAYEPLSNRVRFRLWLPC